MIVSGKLYVQSLEKQNLVLNKTPNTGKEWNIVEDNI